MKWPPGNEHARVSLELLTLWKTLFLTINRDIFQVLKLGFHKRSVVDHINLNLPLHSNNIALLWHANTLWSIQKPFILRSRPPVKLLLGSSIWQTLSVIHNTRFGESHKCQLSVYPPDKLYIATKPSLCQWDQLFCAQMHFRFRYFSPYIVYMD